MPVKRVTKQSQDEKARRVAALRAEVDRIARLTKWVKHGENEGDTDHRMLALKAELSSGGLESIYEDNTLPRVETLVKLAAYARQHDPGYSAIPLFRAAGWLTDADLGNYREAMPAEGGADARVLSEVRAGYLIEEARRRAGLSAQDVDDVAALMRTIVATLERIKGREAQPQAAGPSAHPQNKALG